MLLRIAGCSRRARIAGTILAAAFSWLVFSPAAGAQTISFGIRPASGDASQAYFDFALRPGETVSDAVAISGTTAGGLALQLYAADGITASGGGTAFASRTERRSGDASWISLSASTAELRDGQAVLVSFTVSVPSDATPGDHVAGIIAEAPPRVGATGGVQATVVDRAGIAVVVHIAGDVRREIQFGTFCLNQATGSNFFEIGARNSGDVLARGKGTFELRTLSGDHVFARPVEIGAILPGDQTPIRVHAPQDPLPGTYLATLSVESSDVPAVSTEGQVVVPEKKLDGCLTGEVAGAVDANRSNDNFGIRGLVGAAGGGDGASYVQFGIVGLLLVAIVLLVVRNRRLSRQR